MAAPNHIYLSDLLRSSPQYADDYRVIKVALEAQGISHTLLKGTKDIWCRDYMPVKTADGRLVQFRYEPSYLSGYDELLSDTRDVNRLNGIEAIPADINIDGGNVLVQNGKALISDRICRENPQYANHLQLVDDLENLLEAEVLLVPQINSDMTGHVDGYMRWYDADTVLVTQPSVEYAYWQRGIEQFLKKHSLNAIEVPAFIHREKGFPYSAIGGYVNYLIVGDMLLLPVFDVPGNRDEEVIALFESLFPQLTIVPLVINGIARAGGLIHCVTWEG